MDLKNYASLQRARSDAAISPNYLLLRFRSSANVHRVITCVASIGRTLNHTATQKGGTSGLTDANKDPLNLPGWPMTKTFGTDVPKGASTFVASARFDIPTAATDFSQSTNIVRSSGEIADQVSKLWF